MVLSFRPIVACVGIASLASCSGLHLKGPSSTGVDAGGLQRPGVGSAVARSKVNANAEVRRTCRGSRPSGFIAIDYTASDSTVCPLSPKRRSNYGVALVIRYADMPVGEEIAVCADQAVPAGWSRIGSPPDDPRCPDEEPGREPRPTVMTIRRSR